MGDPSKSFLSTIRSKLGNRRSHSSPPDPTTQRGFPSWDDLPQHNPPNPVLAPPPVPIQHPMRRGPENRPTPPPQTSHSYARYDTRSYQPASQPPRHSHTVPKQGARHAPRAPATPLLQLPKPRAMWRRSLEDMSPSKRMADWNHDDFDTKRMTVDLACALPPQYLDQPPDYAAVEQPASELRRSNPYRDPTEPYRWDAATKQRQNVQRSTRTEHSQYAYQDYYGSQPRPSRQPHDVTIDHLLDHPMLRRG